MQNVDGEEKVNGEVLKSMDCGNCTYNPNTYKLTMKEQSDAYTGTSPIFRMIYGLSTSKDGRSIDHQVLRLWPKEISIDDWL